MLLTTDQVATEFEERQAEHQRREARARENGRLPHSEDLVGTEQMRIFELGGEVPSICLLTFKMPDIEGRGWHKGQKIEGRFTAIIDEVGQADKYGRDGSVERTVQAHRARVLDVKLENG